MLEYAALAALFNPTVPLLICLAAPLLVVVLLRLIGDGGETGDEEWRGKER